MYKTLNVPHLTFLTLLLVPEQRVRDRFRHLVELLFAEVREIVTIVT